MANDPDRVSPARIRVFICDKDHPHAGEVGTMTGKVISVLGTPMAEVQLDNCRHGTNGCFVKKGQVLSEDAFYRRRDRPKP
jgi:hypothetical protein